MKEPMVLHVDENDNLIGLVPKLKAHQEGLLHRAVSVLIFNENGDWLLQKRADEKYHSGGLWSNTCCSHPYPHEEVLEASHRRLMEEMGMKCELNKAYSFTYKAELDNDLIENEIDHLFIGITNDLPLVNLDEVSEFKYLSGQDLENDINENPQNYTEWFKIIFKEVHNTKVLNIKKQAKVA
jgi:isopentenyl-diphosphate delta-isomerase